MLKHQPVLLNEVVEYLAPEPGDTYVDCTLGLAGHAYEIGKRIAPDGVLIGLDFDLNMIELAKERLSDLEIECKLIRSDFRSLKTILGEAGIQVDRMLFDLGLNSVQLETAERGLSFRFDGPLDMRLDQSKPETAEDLLNRLSPIEIEMALRDYGEERYARWITNQIVQIRSTGRMRTVFDLVSAVKAGTPSSYHRGLIHPATKTFMAIRILVNGELENLDRALLDGVDALKVGGRMAVISFHSLEDRIVKHTFQKLSGKCECPRSMPVCVCGAVQRIKLITRKPVTPSESELGINPRSRSSKLRVIEKLV